MPIDNDINIPDLRLMKRRLVSHGQSWLFIVATFIGAVTGALAALLKLMIARVSELFTANFSEQSLNWWLIVIPVGGIVLTGIFQRYIIHTNLTHGVRQITSDLRKGIFNISPKYSYGPMIASTLTLGFGGSAGSEGPIATAGAAIGSNLGRRMGVGGTMLMVMIGCGAGAGIAGIFKAPLGGFLFALEVIKLQMTTMAIMAVLLSCVTSALVAYTLSGFTVDLSYIQIAPFEPRLLVIILIFGIVCGLYSVYYTAIMGHMERFYNRIHNAWLRNISSGLILGVCLMIFPAMYGEGYGVMGHLLNGDSAPLLEGCVIDPGRPDLWTLIIITGLIALIKALACSSTNCGGGVAGDFAPTLFAGCMLGFCFAALSDNVLAGDIPIEAFAFCGMAGVMSGVIGAPFMAIFLTAEMTNGYNLILPLVLVASISYGITRIFNPTVYYQPK